MTELARARPGTALCALLLAAGEGTRLRPLTDTMPKALAPVGNVTLLDRALARLARNGLSGPALVAVNACHLADQIGDHVGARAFVSVEPRPLGTAGALAHLRAWIAGRGVLVGNADAYLAPRRPGPDLAELLDGWDGTTVRVLGVPAEPGRPPEFGELRFAGFSLLPADLVGALKPGLAHLVSAIWRPAERAGRLEVIRYDGRYIDAGTPADYLAANLDAAGGGNLIAPDAQISGQVEQSVVGAGARVAGAVSRSVLLPHSRVAPEENLRGVVRLKTGATITAG